MQFILFCLFFLASIYLFNYLFVRISGIEIGIKQSFALTIPIMLLMFSGVFLGFGYDFLSDGELGNQEMSVAYLGFLILGYILSGIFLSNVLRKRYGFELSAFRCSILNVQVIMTTKLALLVPLLGLFWVLDHFKI